MSYLSERDGAALIAVRVQPRAARDEVAGERDGRLLVRTGAPPVEGAANEAICRLLARAAGVPKRAVTLVSGKRSRDKLLRIEGVSAAELAERLGRR
jgi:uncharacterized protein (TIGR00251 family)